MEFIKPGTNIDFLGKKNVFFFLSAAMIVLTIVLLIWRGGPNYGIDFTGGVLIQVKLGEAHSPSTIKEALRPIDLQDSVIQNFGQEAEMEYLIRVSRTEINLASLGDEVKKALSAKFGDGVDIRRVEMVGPKVGKDLRQKALLAVFFSVLFMGVYISGRFGQKKWFTSIVVGAALVISLYIPYSFGVSVAWLILVALFVTIAVCWILKLPYAIGGIVSLAHDVFILLGAFALTNREVDLSVVAAFLTLVGYSINDTIVVFDRIRENLRKGGKGDLQAVMNSSINETLSRTILTAATVMFVAVTLFILGGGVIHDFAFAMMVGVVVGTYSSIFVASSSVLVLENLAGKGKRARQ